MRLITGKLIEIQIDTALPIGEGAEGIVYPIVQPQELSHYVIKLYKDKELIQDRKSKIEYLIRFAPKLKNSHSVIFPEDIVYDNGAFVGFLMKRAKGEYDLTSLCSLGRNPLLSDEWNDKFDRDTPQGMKNRLRLCYNIASSINQIHATRRFTLVDIKPQNIKISLDGQVSIVDMDSVAIADGYDLLFPAEKFTQEYSPVEYKEMNLKEDLIDETWDRFSLSILFYKILFGLHPFAGTTKGAYSHLTSNEQKISEGLFPQGEKSEFFSVIPEPHKKFKELPKKLQNLFFHCFEEGHFLPSKRPSAEQWCKALAQVAPQKIPTKSISQKKKQKVNPKPIFYTSANSSTGTLPAILIMLVLLTMSFGISYLNEQSKINELKKQYNDVGQDVKETSFQEKLTLIDQHDYVRNIEEGVTWVLKNNKYGLFDQNGHRLTELKYDWASSFKNGFSIVQIGNYFGFINTKGDEITPIYFQMADNFEQEMALVKFQNQFHFIDTDGKFIFTLQYDAIQKYREGLAAFKKMGNWGFMDKKGREVIPARFNDVFPFHEGLALVKKDFLYGYIDYTGKVVIPFQFEKAESFSRGKAKVSLNGFEKWIDTNGDEVY